MKQQTLNKTQASILKALLKLGKAADRPLIAEVVAKQGGATSRGRVSNEAGNYGALTAAKFVHEEKVSIDGSRSAIEYKLLAAGRKALEAHANGLKASSNGKK